MSAHIVLDFNDDGTITLTARPKKKAERVAVPLTPNATGYEVRVMAGDDDKITHKLVIVPAGEMLVNMKCWAA